MDPLQYNNYNPLTNYLEEELRKAHVTLSLLNQTIEEQQTTIEKLKGDRAAEIEVWKTKYLK